MDKGFLDSAVTISPSSATTAAWAKRATTSHGAHDVGRVAQESPEGALSDAGLNLLRSLLEACGSDVANEHAERLITNHGSFANLMHSSPSGLKRSGLDARMIRLLDIIRSSSIYLLQAEIINVPVFQNSGQLADYLTATMSRQKTEQLRMLFLNAKNHLLADEVLSSGTVNHTPVYPREIMRRALELHATALILVHNHPSGDPSPSKRDVEMTEQVRQAADALEIVVHDHIIVGNGRSISLRAAMLLGRRNLKEP